MKTKLVAIAIIVVFSLIAAAPAQAQTTPPQLTVSIIRTASIGEYGVVHIQDNFTVHNNGTSPASYLDFGIPNPYRNNTLYISATDNHGKSLVIESNVNQTSGFYWLRIHFASQLAFNTTYRFVVQSVVADVVTTAPNGLLYNYTAAPVLTQDARVANVTLLGAVGSSFAVAENSTYRQTRVNGYPALVTSFKPWKAYSTDTFVGPYLTVSQYLTDITSAERDIIIDRSGTLHIRDNYNLHNYAIPLTSIAITLPSGASNVMAYDVVGAMWATAEDPTPPYQVSIAPRYAEGIRGGENFAFSLTYDLPQSQYVKQLDWWGNFNLTIPMLDNQEDFAYRTAIIRIQTPSGVTFDNVILPSSNPLAPTPVYNSTYHVIILKDVSQTSNVTLGDFYRFSPFWAAYAYLPWILGLEVVLGAAVLVTKVRRGPEIEIPVPVERLREFVGLYDERISLSRELVAMEDEVARGGMVKHEFRRRSKVMELRLDEINKSLMTVKAEIRAISQHYDELIRRIDRAEAEIQLSRTILNQVRGQYPSGRITRETYDAVTNELNKRTDRAEQTVETI